MSAVPRTIAWRPALLLLAVALLATTATAQSEFIARNYRVRVAVKHDIEKLAVQPTGACQVVSSAGKPLAMLVAQQPYFVQITRGRKADSIFRIVLRELGEHQIPVAVEQAKQAKDRFQMLVKVVRIPAQAREDNRILIMLGEFTSYAAARDAAGKLQGETVKFIYEDRARAREGQVRLLGRDGSILASDGKFLKVVPFNQPVDFVALREIDPGAWTPAAMREGRRYRGEMELTINEDGLLTAVNELWIEHYLYSVVSAEIGGDSPSEAMKAQAIAARSEAVTKIQRGIVSSSFFDFWDTPLCQAYPGAGKETAAVRAAVDATRGEILVCQGQPVDAVYSHSCGGLIADMNDLWDGAPAPYAPSRIDRLTADPAPDLSGWEAAHAWTSAPGDAMCRPDQKGFPNYAKKYFRWQKRFSGEEFSRMMSRAYGTGAVKDLVVERRTPSGRVRKVRVVGENKSVTIKKELELREALGSLYSTFFTFAKSQGELGRISQITFYGAGFGHGVGMCQMGAYMMATKGFNYRQILAHYYQDVRIRRLYK